MSAGARALLFVLGLAVAFGAAFGLGRVAPVDPDPVSSGHDPAHGGQAAVDDGEAGSSTAPTGLEAAHSGYALHLTDDILRPGRQRLGFHVLGPDGAPVVDYDVQHEKRLHLIVVRRDLTGFQHVHPELDADTGVWTIEVGLRPGSWRVIADFKPSGADPLVLGTDLSVPGRFEPRPLGSQRLEDAVDGYRVRLAGEPAAGEATVLTTTVTQDGAPVTDLQPYLGAHGHLVALREGDLAYLHVHPDDDGGSGPDIAFHTEFPTAAGYRLFLDFRHADSVRTAAFTVRPGAGADAEPSDTGSEEPAQDDAHEEDGHDH